MEKRSATLALVDEETRVISGHLVGSVVSATANALRVDYPGNPHGPLDARATVVLPERGESLQGAEVLLVFEGERSDRPIIVGLMREPSPAVKPVEALVDGQRVVIDANDEVVLRCGKASITLRRNGRVVIRGTYVETRAEGVNRIKGGSVQIN